MLSSIIDIESLSKSYATSAGPLKALEDITLTIRSGEFVSVVGQSGCGKSTLLKILAGLTQPSAGEVRLGKQRITGPSTSVGVVFQNALLLPWRTVRENVLFPIDMRDGKRNNYTERANELIALVGLAGFENRYPYELSGGMQQRVAISRALVSDPEVLLMDEPFGALDALLRERMNVELERIWRDSGKTVFFVTHSIPEAIYLSDRVVTISPRPGRIESIVEIDFPRPRDLSIVESTRFGSYATTIREGIGQGSMEGAK